MPNVPQAPGVPPLPGYGPGGIALLEADAIEVLALGLSAISPQWGIYLNGAPIIQPSSVLASTLSLVAPVAAPLAAALGIGFPIFASFVDFEYKQDWTISDYTVEQGGFQSYNKVQIAFDVRVRVASGGTASQRQQFIDTVVIMANSLSLFDVVTPEGSYSSCSIAHCDFKRTAENGITLIVFDIWFLEIRESATNTYGNASTPAVSGSQALGNVQAAPAPPYIQNMIDAGGIT